MLIWQVKEKRLDMLPDLFVLVLVAKELKTDKSSPVSSPLAHTPASLQMWQIWTTHLCIISYRLWRPPAINTGINVSHLSVCSLDSFHRFWWWPSCGCGHRMEKESHSGEDPAVSVQDKHYKICYCQMLNFNVKFIFSNFPGVNFITPFLQV